VNHSAIYGRLDSAVRQENYFQRKSRSPFTTSKALHTICPVQWGSTKSFCGEGIRMRTGSARALLVAVVWISSVTVRAQQPQDGEAQGTAQSRPASLSSGELHASLKAFSVKVEPAPGSSAAPQASSLQTTHRFWDRTNDLWFAAVGAGRALDYASTLNLRRRGVDEIFLTNSIVDNHPLFAGIEAAGTAASIGVSYLFHRTGHHQLERWTSIVHFGVATGGAARNYALKTPHHP
jgi:hypothetical protein